MKLTVYERMSRPETMTLDTEPMIVWFDRATELRIEKGDELYKIADAIENHWGLSYDDAVTLAACWFAMGERQHFGRHQGGWTSDELKTTLKRRYLIDAAKRSGAQRPAQSRPRARPTSRTSAKKR